MTRKQSKRILIIDDDETLKDALTDDLDEEGFLVTWCTNAETAFQEMRENTPDVILLDMVMVNIDGFAVLRTLKKDEELKNIPVVVLSNLGEKKDVKKAKDLGADNYLIKAELSLKDIIKEILKMV